MIVLWDSFLVFVCADYASLSCAFAAHAGAGSSNRFFYLLHLLKRVQVTGSFLSSTVLTEIETFRPARIKTREEGVTNFLASKGRVRHQSHLGKVNVN